MNKLISLRLPETLFKTVEELSNLNGYTSMQDYIRETIRERIIRDRVMAVAGSQKGNGKLLTKAELNKLASEHYESLFSEKKS